jgi:hypothetical protein
VRLLISFDRGDDVPCGDGGVVEHARQPVEQRLAAERLAGNGLASAWAMNMAGNSGCNRQQIEFKPYIK